MAALDHFPILSGAFSSPYRCLLCLIARIRALTTASFPSNNSTAAAEFEDVLHPIEPCQAPLRWYGLWGGSELRSCPWPGKKPQFSVDRLASCPNSLSQVLGNSRVHRNSTHSACKPFREQMPRFIGNVSSRTGRRSYWSRWLCAQGRRAPGCATPRQATELFYGVAQIWASRMGARAQTGGICRGAETELTREGQRPILCLGE